MLAVERVLERETYQAKSAQVVARGHCSLHGILDSLFVCFWFHESLLRGPQSLFIEIYLLFAEDVVGRITDGAHRFKDKGHKGVLFGQFVGRLAFSGGNAGCGQLPTPLTPEEGIQGRVLLDCELHKHRNGLQLERSVLTILLISVLPR